ncbi:Homeodomain-like protein, partial [Paraphysoderma sedebokerense]
MKPKRTGSNNPSGKRTWSAEEDELLRDAVKTLGTEEFDVWGKIAKLVPGRSTKACRKRWYHSLDPEVKKGQWTAEEDEKLKAAVNAFGTHWTRVALDIPGRTDDQCAKRWKESLDPSIVRTEWTSDEDALLLHKYAEHGPQWQVIAKFFPGRPGLHIRNRFRKLDRMM